ncbi:MAG: hypothetical protein EB141_03570, partial [Verrucomicrobia bacterium]|nr:hypothetical protein [Verrucomicrobiota bacterium]
MRRLAIAGWFALVAAAIAAAPKASDAASHWSYQPVVRPALPSVKNSAWALNDLDRFILAKLEAKG